jgi:hypothetical protein
MLATTKDLCCLIQPTRILYRSPGINNCLHSVWANSNWQMVHLGSIDNSNHPQRSSRPYNRAVHTAINYCLHQINTIVFGCYLGETKFAPAPKEHNQKFVLFPQIAKSSTLLATEPGIRSALTKPLSINFLAVLSPKFELEASPFWSSGGVSKYQ